MKKKVAARQKRNVPEFEPPPPETIGSIRQNFQSLSADTLKNIEILKKNFLENESVNYIYEINFPEDSKLIEIESYAFKPKISFSKSFSNLSSNLYSIALPPSLKKIDPHAFDSCNQLSEIKFLANSTLISIGDSAFESTILESFIVPASVEEIGSNCFPKTLKSIEYESGCPNLTSIGSFDQDCKLDKIGLPLHAEISEEAFSKCKYLKTIIFDKFDKSNQPEATSNQGENNQEEEGSTNPQEKEDESVNSTHSDDDNQSQSESFRESRISIFPASLENLEFSVSDLKKYLFEHTSNLNNINVEKPNSKYVKVNKCIYTKDFSNLIVAERDIKQVSIKSECKQISNYAFSTPSLESVKFENREQSKLKLIDSFAFHKSCITQVIIPDSVEIIYDHAFSECSRLEKVVLPNSLRIISNFAFMETSLVEITIPKHVSEIGCGSFMKIPTLRVVKFEENSSLELIDFFAFAYTSITSLQIPNTVRYINNSAFYSCSSLTSLKFDDKSKLEMIMSDAFTYTNLASVKIPKSVTTIESAFRGCINLSQVKIEEGSELKEIGKDCFKDTKVDNITLPSTILSFDFNNAHLNKIRFLGNPAFAAIDDRCFEHTLLTEITIPSNVAYIHQFAFYNCANLITVKLQEPSSLLSIGNYAFRDCPKLANLNLPKTVRFFGAFCFEGCANYAGVINVDINDSLTFGQRAFYKSGVRQLNLKSSSVLFKSSSFACTKQLDLIDIESSSIFVKEYAFENSNIQTFKFNDPSQFTLSDAAFRNSSINSFYIVAPLEIIPNECFKDCLKLTNVQIDPEIKTLLIKDKAFYNTGIQKILFPVRTIVFQYQCFANCKNLEIFSFGEKTKIRSYAFLIEYYYYDYDPTLHMYLPEAGKIKDATKLDSFNPCLLAGCENIKNLEPVTYTPTLLYTEADYKFPLKLFNIINGNAFYYDSNLSNTHKDNFELINDVLYTSDHKNIICCELRLQTINIIREAEIINSQAFQFSRIKHISFAKESTITTIEPFAFAETQLVSIELPDSVTLIDNNAFDCCMNLKTVKINNTSKLTSIGDHCFYNTRIESILLPPTLKSIGSFAFYNCKKLVNVDNYSKKLNIGSEAFSRSAIDHFEFPPEVVFDDNSFDACTRLLQIEFLDDPIDVQFNSHSFTNSAIENLFLSTGRIVINDHAFYNCSSLSKIKITTDTAQVDLNAFECCPVRQLTVLNWDSFPDMFNTLDYFKSNTYLYSNRCHIKNQEVIGFDLFDTPYIFEKENPRNKKKKAQPKNPFHIIKPNESIEVPQEALSINAQISKHIKQFGFEKGSKFKSFCPYLFEYSNLLKITIPKFVQIIPKYLFNNCYYLKHVNFEKGSKLTQICEYAFANTAIKEIDLPNRLNIIEPYAFYNCKRLRNIVFNGETIGEYAFAHSGLFQFEASNALKQIGQYAFYNCVEMTNFVIDADESKIETIGPYAFAQTSLTEFHIPVNVQIVEEGLLAACLKLKRTIFSAKSKATVIKKYAFANNPLLQVIRAPKTIRELSGKAFINTPSLITLFNESNDLFEVTKDLTVYKKDRTLVFVPRHVTSVLVLQKCSVIHSGAFCGPKLKSVQFLDESLVMIERCAFAHTTNLKSLNLPKSLQFIGSDAFIDCQNLETVVFDAHCQLLNIPKFCFAFSGLKRIELPYSIQNIQNSAFYFCTNLKSINLYDTDVRYIGHNAFSCTAITDIKFPESIQTISRSIFDGNKSLNTIDLQDAKSLSHTYSDMKHYKKAVNAILHQKNAIKTQVTEMYKNAALINDKEKRLCIQITKKNKPDVKPAFNLTSKIDPKIIKPGFGKKNGQTTNPRKKQFDIHEPTEQPVNQSPKAAKKSPINAINTLRPDNIARSPSKCLYLNQLAFFGSSVSTIILNQPSYQWLDFFNYCHNLKNIIMNKDIELKVSYNNKYSQPIFEKSNENNQSENEIYYPEIFDLCGIKYDKLTKLPALNYNDDIVAFKFIPPMNEISPSCFYYCTNLITISFDKDIDIKVIPEKCFSFTKIQQVELPNSIEIIGKEAFAYCSELEVVKISAASALTHIECSAFYECTKLKSIYLPASLQHMETFAFANSGLAEITFEMDGSKLDAIPYCCFMNTELVNVFLPDNVKTIEEMAFANCTKLKTVALNDNLVEIGLKAFFNDSLLDVVDIPDSVKIIDKWAFANCSKLKHLNTTEHTNLVEIRNFALCGTQVESIALNWNATTIFDPCNVPKLQRIIFNGGPPVNFRIDSNGLIYEIDKENRYITPPNVDIENYEYSKPDYYRNVCDMYHKHHILAEKFMSKKKENTGELLILKFAPKNSTSLNIAFDCYKFNKYALTDMKKLKSISYGKGLLSIVSQYPDIQNSFHDIHFSADLVYLKSRAFLGKIKLELVDFGNSSIYKIPKKAFMNCTALKSITIPSQCRSIRVSAFENCTSLSTITFNEQLIDICNQAFMNCTSLKKLTFPSSLKYVDRKAFYGCSNLNEIECNNLLTRIGQMAFMNCQKLTTVHLCCTDIGAQAFKNCTSLTTVNCDGLEGIPCGMFYNCTQLTNLSLKISFNKKPVIASEAFMNCTKLASVDIKVDETAYEEHVAKVEEDLAKKGKEKEWLSPLVLETLKRKLFHFRISRNLNLQDRAFMNCTSLMKVKIDFSRLRFFSPYAFANCKLLKLIEITSQFWSDRNQSKIEFKIPQQYLETYDSTTFLDTPEQLIVQIGSERLKINELQKPHYPLSTRMVKKWISKLNKNLIV